MHCRSAKYTNEKNRILIGTHLFLSDFSDAELSALKQVFPATTVLVVIFIENRLGHSGFKIDRKNALDSNDARLHLLGLICACVCAPPGKDDMDLDAKITSRRCQYSGICMQCGRKMHIQSWLNSQPTG